MNVWSVCIHGDRSATETLYTFKDKHGNPKGNDETDLFRFRFNHPLSVVPIKNPSNFPIYLTVISFRSTLTATPDYQLRFSFCIQLIKQGAGNVPLRFWSIMTRQHHTAAADLLA